MKKKQRSFAQYTAFSYIHYTDLKNVTNNVVYCILEFLDLHAYVHVLFFLSSLRKKELIIQAIHTNTHDALSVSLPAWRIIKSNFVPACDLIARYKRVFIFRSADRFRNSDSKRNKHWKVN